MLESSTRPGPRLFVVMRAVGWVTFLEILRDKVLYNIVLFALLLFGAGFLASKLTFVRPERVILDFGLAAIGVACAMVAVFTGASVLAREFDRRTIYVALSHPISRHQFVLGKYLGLAAVVAVNWLLLSSTFIAIIVATAPAPAEILHGTLFAALFLVLLQALVVAAIAIMFSSFATTSLTVIVTIGLYLIGQNISQLRLIAAKSESEAGAWLLKALALLLPNFEAFNLGAKVTYGLPVGFWFVLTGVAYAFCLLLVFLLAAGLLIRGREV